MADRLIVPGAIVAQLLDHARTESPNEACGLLSGSLQRREADAYHPARNAACSPLRYDLDPRDLVRTVMGIERDGRDLVAIFHSHTRSPGVPSATDRRHAAYPGVLHLILGVDGSDHELRAWRLDAEPAEEVALEVAPSAGQQSSTDSSTTRAAEASMVRSIRHEPSSPPDR